MEIIISFGWFVFWALSIMIDIYGVLKCKYNNTRGYMRDCHVLCRFYDFKKKQVTQQTKDMLKHLYYKRNLWGSTEDWPLIIYAKFCVPFLFIIYYIFWYGIHIIFVTVYFVRFDANDIGDYAIKWYEFRNVFGLLAIKYSLHIVYSTIPYNDKYETMSYNNWKDNNDRYQIWKILYIIFGKDLAQNILEYTAEYTIEIRMHQKYRIDCVSSLRCCTCCNSPNNKLDFYESIIEINA